MQAESTLPKLLLRNAKIWANRDAMREKEYGIWFTYTWRDYAEEVRRFALGLAAIGFKRGDKLAVIGENRPRLYFAMLAAQSLGGISLAAYQDSIAKEMGFILSHAETRFIVAENEEQVDKLFEIRDQIPTVERIIFSDPRGLALKNDPWLIHFPKVQELGDEFTAKNPGYFDDEVAKGEAEDVAILSYTSGTTGEPKAAMLSHKNLQASYTTYAEVEGWNEKDEMVAYLPMAWIGDFGFSVVSALAAGVTINCIESPETYRRDLREIGPTLFLGPPRQWENTTTTIQVRMEDADWIKRTLYETFLKLGLKVERLKQAGEPVPLLLKALNTLGRWLVWLPLLDAVGARRVRKAYTGGAPLGPDVFDFFRAQGINLKVGYGLTESAGFGLLQPDGEANSETVGVPLGDVELKIAENGEILMRGPNNFKGYYKNEEATRKTLDKDGWLYTGDAGFMDKNGHLRVIDRAKDVSKLKDGTLFAPQFLENKLKFSPYIKEAVTLGKERDYVAAIINIDLDSLENWAERKNVTYSGYQELSQKPEVYELIQEEITRINRSFSEDKELAGAQIRRFLILNKELDPDDGEITRTRKVRRGVISERYGKLIEALFSDADRVETDIMVTYEDGRTGTIHSNLQIREIGGPPPTPRQEIKRSA